MKAINNRAELGAFNLVYLAVFFLFIPGCIQEIELFQGEQTPLIVSGEVTNEKRVHNVRLLFMEGYNMAPDFTKVRDASVQIIDDLGNVTNLQYTGYGFFETPDDFQGVVGRSYHVVITLSDGRKYSSIPEEILEVPEVTEVSYQTNGTEIIFNVDYKDTKGEANYYRWRFSGTFEVYAPYADADRGPIPRNSRCYPSSGTVPQVSNCWVNDSDNGFIKVESDVLYDGMERSEVPIYHLDIDRKFNFGYSAEVRQYSLTAEAYRFWTEIENQLGNTGSIFETANYQIIGNLRSDSDPNELVLGYFGASAVSSSRVFVDQFVGTFPPENCETNNAGCRPARCVSCLYYDNSSTESKPDFWPY